MLLKNVFICSLWSKSVKCDTFQSRCPLWVYVILTPPTMKVPGGEHFFFCSSFKSCSLFLGGSHVVWLKAKFVLLWMSKHLMSSWDVFAHVRQCVCIKVCLAVQVWARVNSSLHYTANVVWCAALQVKFSKRCFSVSPGLKNTKMLHFAQILLYFSRPVNINSQ